jgi:hypothetical protein
MTLKTFAKTGAYAASCMMIAGLAGCGMVDDVQMNGKLFDALGVNSTGSVKKEAKVAERQPLIVPPGLDKLPTPGANGAAAQANAIPGVEDHDVKKIVSQEALQNQQAEYCKVHYEQAKQHGDNNADLAEGPMGPCRGSVFSAVKKLTGGEGEEAQ